MIMVQQLRPTSIAVTTCVFCVLFCSALAHAGAVSWDPFWNGGPVVMGQGTVSLSLVNWDTFNLVCNVDYEVLPSLFGVDPIRNSTFANYTPIGWLGSLSGTYQSIPFSIIYSGKDSGPLGFTWTGTGSFGSSSFTSAGSGFASADGFSVAGYGSLGRDTWTWQGTMTYSADQESLSGIITYSLDGGLGSGNYTRTGHFSGYKWVDGDMHPLWNYDPSPTSGQLGWVSAAPIPEPSTITLLGLGASGLLPYAWRRRKAKAKKD